MIFPKRSIKADDAPLTANVQLCNLTDFVAFLERWWMNQECFMSLSLIL